jgi:hypothetical protein
MRSIRKGWRRWTLGGREAVYVTSHYPDRCFAFDQFGPLSIRPCHGTCRAPRRHPARLRATYHRTHGIRYFHGCYGIGDDQLWGVVREHKGADHTLAALKSIRAIRAGSHLCHGQLGPPQSPRTGPPAAGLPALAQRPRPPSRRPGRPAPRTGPHPQRAPATLGPPQAEGCMTGRQMWRQPPACWTAGSSPGRAQRRAMPRQTCLNGSPVWRCGTWTGPRCSSCHSPRSSRR